MGADVVFLPTVLCPECGCVMHRTSVFEAHAPLPMDMGMRCLNSRCTDHGRVKRVPLERVNVEVSDEPAGLTD